LSGEIITFFIFSTTESQILIMSSKISGLGKTEKIVFFVDDKIITGFSLSKGSTVMSGKGSIHINTWTGNPKWGGGPPDRDSWMILERVSYWKI
jgi:hypothetical protein